MKRYLIAVASLLLAGCTTCPQAGFMDRVFPSRNACGPACCEAPPTCQPIPAPPVYSTVPMGATVVGSGVTVVRPGLVMEYPSEPIEKEKKHRLFGWFGRKKNRDSAG